MHMHAHIHSVHTNMHAHNINIFMCTPIFLHSCSKITIYARTYVHTYCKSGGMLLCKHVNICLDTQTNKQTHTHTHIVTNMCLTQTCS